MPNVINITAHIASIQAKAAASEHLAETQRHDEFLLNEGLELIAYFRAIKSLSVRSSTLDLVRKLATAKI